MEIKAINDLFNRNLLDDELISAVTGLEESVELLRQGDVITSSQVSSEYHVFDILKIVTSYSLDGVIPSEADMSTLEDSLVDLISVTLQARIVGELQGQGCVPANLEILLETLFARLKLDSFQGRDLEGVIESAAIASLYPSFDCNGLTVTDLARLSGVSKSAMRSVLHQESITLLKDGTSPSYLPFDQCVHFLTGRPKFVKSYEASGADDDQLLSVPVAKDGSRFNRNCRRKQGYQIGSKGSERYFSNFYDALVELKKMPTARWRRPSKTSGTPGIVSAVRWERVSKSELGLD